MIECQRMSVTSSVQAKVAHGVAVTAANDIATGVASRGPLGRGR